MLYVSLPGTYHITTVQPIGELTNRRPESLTHVGREPGTPRRRLRVNSVLLGSVRRWAVAGGQE